MKRDRCALVIIAAVLATAVTFGGCATTAAGVDVSEPAVGPPPAETTPAPAETPEPAGALQPAPTAEPAPVHTPVAAASVASTASADVTTGARARASRVVSRGRTDRRAVALTFDAGSDRGRAEFVLDVLAQERAPAAFGVTGEWGNANRDLLARMIRDGHALINHSYDHSSFTGASWPKVARTRTERESQLDRTEQVFRAAAPATAETPLSTPYFRPPFGDYDAGVLADLGALGYPITVMWSVDSMGWRGWTAPQITQRCLEGAHAGAIYIFHVGSASSDAEALSPIIKGLRAHGYDILPLADLLEDPGAAR